MVGVLRDQSIRLLQRGDHVVALVEYAGLEPRVHVAGQVDVSGALLAGDTRLDPAPRRVDCGGPHPHDVLDHSAT